MNYNFVGPIWIAGTILFWFIAYNWFNIYKQKNKIYSLDQEEIKTHIFLFGLFWPAVLIAIPCLLIGYVIFIFLKSIFLSPSNAYLHWKNTGKTRTGRITGQ